MPRKKIVNIHQINGNNLTEKDHSFHIQHLEKGIRLIDSMSRRHSKVLQERVDLRYPKTVKSDGSNADFSTTLQNYTKDLTRKPEKKLMFNILPDGNKVTKAIILICMWRYWWMAIRDVAGRHYLSKWKSIGQIR